MGGRPRVGGAETLWTTVALRVKGKMVSGVGGRAGRKGKESEPWK